MGGRSGISSFVVVCTGAWKNTNASSRVPCGGEENPLRLHGGLEGWECGERRGSRRRGNGAACLKEMPKPRSWRPCRGAPRSRENLFPLEAQPGCPSIRRLPQGIAVVAGAGKLLQPSAGSSTASAFGERHGHSPCRPDGTAVIWRSGAWVRKGLWSRVHVSVKAKRFPRDKAKAEPQLCAEDHWAVGALPARAGLPQNRCFFK